MERGTSSRHGPPGPALIIALTITALSVDASWGREPRGDESIEAAEPEPDPDAGVQDAGSHRLVPASVPSTGQSLGIASVPNLRDLGGYTTRDGSVVRSGLVYRSNQLSGISPQDMKKLAALTLVNVYDLRTADERKERPDELPRGVHLVVLDVMADTSQTSAAELERLLHDPPKANAALGGGKAEAAFEKVYREIVSLPSAKRAYHTLFLSLGQPGKVPALFHCTTGKDRTGWAAAALLTLLGVPREQVMADYLRSNEYILPAYQKRIDAFVAAGGDPEIPQALLGVKTAYLDAAFDEMQKEYGTVERYFSDGLGIDVAQQDALRKLYLTTAE